VRKKGSVTGVRTEALRVAPNACWSMPLRASSFTEWHQQCRYTKAAARLRFSG